MKILLKSCKLIASGSSHNGKVVDLLISDGTIQKIADQIADSADQTIEIPNLHVSCGWFDAKVHFCDPGDEVMEDIESGKKAAAAGGFTAVGLNPATQPPLSNKSQIEYVKGNSQNEMVEIHPYGTITDQLKGENLSEMYEMQQSGAIGFTDDHKHIAAGIMYRALLYAKNFDGRVISFPWDKSIFGKGYVHEGKASVLTGLKSIPAIAEYLMVQQNLSLLEYTDSSIHFSGISTAKSVDLIREARKTGLKVTADCYVQNVVFNEDEVLGFDSSYKVLPPLRSEEDRKALIAGLKDGTIDAVCSDHRPQDVEHKDVEFDHASFGMIGVQTLFPALNGIEELSLEEKINLISTKSRNLFGLDRKLEEGEKAELTLFDPETVWTVEKADLNSKSKNTPLIGKELKGKVLGTINNGHLNLL